MTVRTNKDDNKLYLYVEGRLDSNTSPDLEEIIHKSLEGVSDIIFDFEKLEYLSSAGIRIILACAIKMKKTHGTVTVKNLCALVREVLELTGIIDVINVE